MKLILLPGLFTICCLSFCLSNFAFSDQGSPRSAFNQDINSFDYGTIHKSIPINELTTDDERAHRFVTAVQDRDTKAVDELLALGVSVNSVGYGGTTALVAAVANDDLEMIEKLINLGADINQPSYCGRTPLFLAAQRGNLALVQFFFQNGADLNALDDYRSTALSKAAYYYLDPQNTPKKNQRLKDVIRFLLENEATAYLHRLTLSFPGLELIIELQKEINAAKYGPADI